jgi:hypothetical protein
LADDNTGGESKDWNAWAFANHPFASNFFAAPLPPGGIAKHWIGLSLVRKMLSGLSGKIRNQGTFT